MSLQKKVKVLVIVYSLFSFNSISQNIWNDSNTIKEITLEGVLQIASKNSLDAFKAKRKYAYGYWEFKSFKASLLPKVTFNSDPLTYRSSVVERYDSELNQDVFRPIRSLNSFAGLSLSQNIASTGGTISLNSTYNKLTNFNNGRTNRFSVTPVNLRLRQPLMAFNVFKWRKQTAPLEYEKSKKELVYELQDINVKTVRYFFNWALASKKEEMAKQKVASSKRLFKIGKKRYDIGSIEKEDVLNLELQLYDAETELTIKQKELERVKNELSLYLRDSTVVQQNVPVLPELISNLKIDALFASKLYKENNPKMLNLAITKIESERDLDRTIKENRFDLSVTAGYGLNQQAEEFANVYNNLLEQQNVAIKFSIPILDWGERKGRIKKARMNKEVQDIDVQQAETRLKQELQTKIVDFNLQEKLVLSAMRASEIAKESYHLTEKRFLSGRVDLLRLTSALKAWQSSNESYMLKLLNYLRYYYEIQQFTLYDFREDRKLKIDNEKGILD